jgi:uncharacterized protein
MNLLQLILVGALQLYRWIVSPAKGVVFGPLARCRHSPSCSAYALEAVQRHGAVRGSWLALGRLSRCHPWGTSGYDPVPAVPFPPRTLVAPENPKLNVVSRLFSRPKA